jgi:hypothetical protein
MILVLVWSEPRYEPRVIPGVGVACVPNFALLAARRKFGFVMVAASQQANLNTKGSRTHTLLEHVPVFETASHISLLLCVRGSVP